MPLTVDQLIALLSVDDAEGVVVAGRYAIILRDPQPDETGIAISSTVTARVVDLDGDPAAPPTGFTMQVEIDLGSGFVVAFDGASFAAPWTGAGSTTAQSSATDPYLYIEVTCDQSPAVLSSEQVVGVRVSAGATGGFGFGPFGTGAFGSGPPTSPTISETYYFTAEDLTAPRLVSAEPIDQKTVRVRFNEEMQDDPEGGNATIVSTLAEPFNFSGGETLDARVEGGSAQTATFLLSNFIDPSNATAEEVASVLSASLDGASAIAVSGYVHLLSDEVGDSVTMQVTGGDANTILGFPTTVATGSSLSVLSEDNFTIARQTTPPTAAVNLSVVSVAVADTTAGAAGEEFDLTLNWEMTPLADYLLTVDGDVEDVSGNAIDPDWTTAAFAGFQPTIPEGRRWDLWKFIPLVNREQDNAGTGHLRRFINVLQEALDLITYEVDRFTDQYDPDKATDDQIDAMLYDVGNPFAAWTDLELTALEKRKLLRVLVSIYKLKGTAVGVESVVRFLLGKEVEVVDYISDGWVLGVDELGEGAQAEIVSGAAETYDFSGVDRDLYVAIDGGSSISAVSVPDQDFTILGERASEFLTGRVFRVVESTGNDGTYTVAAPGAAEVGGVTIIPVASAIPDATADGRIVQRLTFSSTAGVDFVTPSAAEAEEVATAIEAQLLGGGAYAPLIGTRAIVTGTIAPPWIISPGDSFSFTVNGSSYTVTLDGTETDALDVAEKINNQSSGVVAGAGTGGVLEIMTLVYGAGQSLQVAAGALQAVLGLPTTLATGSDAARVVIESDTVGVDSIVEALGGTAATVLDFPTGAIGGSGGAELAPGDSYTLYCFDVVSSDPLSSIEEQIIRRIADYMKPAHTHLKRVTGPTAPVPVEGWQLGLSTLGDESELME